MQIKSLSTIVMCTTLVCFIMFLLSACDRSQSYLWKHDWLSPERSSQFAGSIRPRRGDAASHYLLACYFQDRKKHKLALDEFRTSVDLDPTFVKAYNGMGISYDSLGDHAQAIISYRSALQVNPNLDYVLNNLGYAYLLDKNPEHAVKSFQKAIALNEENARYHNNLGLAYAELGMYPQALSEFKLAGSAEEAHRNIARILYKDGLYVDAAKQFAQVSELNPEDMDTEQKMKAAETMADILDAPESNMEKDVNHLNPMVVPMEYSGVTCLGKEQTVDGKSSPEASAEPDPKPVITKNWIEVSNGNGVGKMARKVGEYLNSKELQLMYLTNADHFNYPNTVIYYRSGYLQAATHAAEKLPGPEKLEMVSHLEKERAAIRVLIGRDIIPYLSSLNKG